MPNLSIKDVPEAWVEVLRQRASRNHRSLQGELMALVEQVLAEAQPPPAPVIRAAGERHGTRTIAEVMAGLRARQPELVPGQPLAVDIIRADRDSR